MKAIGSIAVALVAALTTVGAASALESATSDGETGTRVTYVVGGEVVHPPRANLDVTTLDPATSGPYSTRQAYVVGGVLVGAGR